MLLCGPPCDAGALLGGPCTIDWFVDAGTLLPGPPATLYGLLLFANPPVLKSKH